MDFAELFLLKPVAQKIKLKQEFDLVRRRQTFDSLYFSFLGKPFSNFIGSTIARTDIPSTYGDSVEILIRHSQALAPVFDTYYIGITGLQFRRFILDENCNPYTGSKPLTSACFSVLAQKTLPANPNNFAEIKDYLNKCGFSGFPARFNNSCLDGDYVTIYVKNLGQYQVVYVHCPDELHPLRIILNKVKYFLELK
ncbi:hypothetical protein [Haliscomenobacter sp.]|uniref:hypothetical protein n=1 Tax=Haliscomenobacter sp. TaxID=2717303 RepID=UPI003592FE98